MHVERIWDQSWSKYKIFLSKFICVFMVFWARFSEVLDIVEEVWGVLKWCNFLAFREFEVLV